MANKYLIIGPAWVGDLVMAQSLFKLIKSNEPNAIIHLMVSNAYLPMVAAMPEVDKGMALPLKHGEFNLKARYHIAQTLKGQYTHSIVLPNSWKSALIPFFAKVPKRIGWKGEMRWGLINDIRYLDKTKLPLMIERFCALGLLKNASLPKDLPQPALKLQQKTIEWVKTKFNLNLGKPILALCPGAEFGPAKRWPAYHYIEVAKAKMREGYDIWLLGAKGDALVGEEIQAGLNQKAINFIGNTDLGEAMALLSLASKVVSNDSGLMHIANAVGTPTVVVYGSSSPKFTPPLSDKAEIVAIDLACRPCFKRKCPLIHMNCLHKLPAQDVLNALEKAEK